jgi:hypothetical protein
MPHTGPRARVPMVGTLDLQLIAQRRQRAGVCDGQMKVGLHVGLVERGKAESGSVRLKLCDEYVSASVGMDTPRPGAYLVSVSSTYDVL